MASVMRDAVVGAAAGLAGTEVMDRVSTLLYERTPKRYIQREQEIEADPPPAVLVRKIEQGLDRPLTDQQKHLLRQLFHYGTGVAPTVLYALAARRSRGGWLAKGLIFGRSSGRSSTRASHRQWGWWATTGSTPWRPI